MSNKEEVKFSDSSGIGLSATHEGLDIFNPCGAFKITCRSSDGSIRWEEESPNLVVNQGKNDLLNQYFRGSAYNALFYVGLKGAGAVAATDTMAASPRVWSEITAYVSTNRPAYTTVAPTSQSVTNSASPAVFSINGTATVAGCFITNTQPRGGVTGTLFSAVDFGVARSVLSGDTLTVTYTVSC